MFFHRKSCQRLAVSFKLLEERRQYTPNLHCLLSQLLVVAGFDQLEVSGEQQMTFQFACRTRGK
jgi:hypothetical protein